MKTLDRYLLRETLPLFGGGLLVIVLLFLGGAVYEVLAPLVAKGADPYTLLRYLLFRTPEALARGAPVAYLFALLVLLSRLGEDAELKALLALGVRRERLLLPFLLLGTAIALAAFLLGEGLVPQALAKGQDLLRREVLERPRALLTPGATFQDAQGRVVYVGKVEGRPSGPSGSSPGRRSSSPSGEASAAGCCTWRRGPASPTREAAPGPWRAFSGGARPQGPHL